MHGYIASNPSCVNIFYWLYFLSLYLRSTFPPHRLIAFDSSYWQRYNEWAHGYPVYKSRRWFNALLSANWPIAQIIPFLSLKLYWLLLAYLIMENSLSSSSGKHFWAVDTYLFMQIWIWILAPMNNNENAIIITMATAAKMPHFENFILTSI